MAYKCLILDSRDSAVARGAAEELPNNLWRLRLDEQDVAEVMKHTNLKLVSVSEKSPALEGKILRREGNCIYLEMVSLLQKSVRENLRMPVRFVSFLYPVSGQWQGRVPIVSNDLSCGGLSFFSPRPLAVGELVEIVIPVTAKPLVLTLEILRTQEFREEGHFYAGRFVDLVREEESMVREAVFSLQLQRN